MPKPLLTLLFAIVVAPLAAQSPGFDCTKATTPIEKTICADPDLSKTDGEMAEAYRAWLNATPPDQQEQIRQSQRAWLHDRLAQCLTRDKTAAISTCLRDSEKGRLSALRNMIEHRDGITFVWQPLYLTAPDDADTAKLMKQINGRDSGYVDASWPQAAGSDPEWLAWNKAVAEAAGPGNFEGKNKPAKQWTKADAVDQDTDVSVRLNLVTESLVSASITIDTYSHGAAHPNHGTSQLNWMLKEQRPAEGKDIFNPDSKWEQELYDRVSQYLHKTLDADGANYENWLNDPQAIQKTVRGLAADPNRWQIDDKGITIVFNPYEIACYACTPENFSVSWENLKPILNPAFVIPTR
jgi:uncharacterized protein